MVEWTGTREETKGCSCLVLGAAEYSSCIQLSELLFHGVACVCVCVLILSISYHDILRMILDKGYQHRHGDDDDML